MFAALLPAVASIVVAGFQWDAARQANAHAAEIEAREGEIVTTLAGVIQAQAEACRCDP